MGVLVHIYLQYTAKKKVLQIDNIKQKMLLHSVNDTRGVKKSNFWFEYLRKYFSMPFRGSDGLV